MMDPATLLRWLGRHKVLALLLVVATALGVRHVLFRPFSEFESRAAVLLVTPGRAPAPPADAPPAPTRKDNPYLRDYSPAVVITVVSSYVNSPQARDELQALGADRRYQVLPPSKYGYVNAIAEMRITGATPEGAQLTAQLVVEAFQERLEEIQAAEGADPSSFIRTRVVREPTYGLAVVPGRVRAVAGVLGLGAIGLFTLVSTVDFVETVRNTRQRRRVAPSGSPA